MTESHRPRHALDDDHGQDPDYTSEDGYADGYDEAFVFDDSGEYPAEQPAEDARGLPLRGLAMILLAVAVILIGWGGYSLLNGDDDSTDTTAQSESAQEPNRGEGAGEGDRPESSGDAEKPDKAENAGDADNPENADAPRADNQGNAAAEQQNGAAGAEAAVDKNKTYVAVLNNSRIQGLAGDVAGKLDRDQWTRTGVGNLPDQSGTFPNSVVLYPRGDAQAQAAAEAVARDLGLKTQPRDGNIDRALEAANMLEGPEPAGVVVVTTNDMPR